VVRPEAIGHDGSMLLETPIGPLGVAASEVGLVRVCFGGDAEVDAGAPRGVVGGAASVSSADPLRDPRAVAPVGLPGSDRSAGLPGDAGSVTSADLPGQARSDRSTDPRGDAGTVTSVGPLAEARSGASADLLTEIRRQLEDYFAGRRRAFDLPLDWSLTSGFQRRVLQELYAEVGFGDTVTYGELAGRVGHTEAARAVGIAMATNPLPVVVPCHRVVASGGQLGGFGGGLEMKRWLLTHEGALPPTLFPIENVTG
jgi:methylated-DNA-[protein]-cysteine S-methyltransferase